MKKYWAKHPNIIRTVVNRRLSTRSKILCTVFGNNCYKCGAEVYGRQANLHKKDFSPHKQVKFMNNNDFNYVINHPEEWEKLCVKCHGDIHGKRGRPRKMKLWG